MFPKNLFIKILFLTFAVGILGACATCQTDAASAEKQKAEYARPYYDPVTEYSK